MPWTLQAWTAALSQAKKWLLVGQVSEVEGERSNTGYSMHEK